MIFSFYTFLCVTLMSRIVDCAIISKRIRRESGEGKANISVSEAGGDKLAATGNLKCLCVNHPFCERRNETKYRDCKGVCAS